HKGRGEHHQLIAAGDVHDVEVGSKVDTSRHIGQDTEGHSDNGRGTGSESIKSVGQVGAIGNGGNDQDHHQDKDHPYRLIGIVAQPAHQPAVVEIVVLHK